MDPTQTGLKRHSERNVKRFHEMPGIRQEVFAGQLGGDGSQKKIPLLESKETIELALLYELAKALKVPGEAIRSFSEEAVFNIIANTIYNHDQPAVENYYPTFNPFDNIVELYEALWKSERGRWRCWRGCYTQAIY